MVYKHISKGRATMILFLLFLCSLFSFLNDKLQQKSIIDSVDFSTLGYLASRHNIEYKKLKVNL